MARSARIRDLVSPNPHPLRNPLALSLIRFAREHKPLPGIQRAVVLEQVGRVLDQSSKLFCFRLVASVQRSQDLVIIGEEGVGAS